MVSASAAARSRRMAFAAVLLMAAAAFGAASIAADDSDASTYTFDDVPRTLTPYPGDIIKITGVSKINANDCNCATLSGDTVTVTVPQSIDNQGRSHILINVSGSDGSRKVVYIKTSEHLGMSKMIYIGSNGDTDFVINGATVSISSSYTFEEETGEYEEEEHSFKVTSVTPGYGLSVTDDGDLTGVINAPAGTVIDITSHRDDRVGSSSESSDETCHIYVVAAPQNLSVPDQSVAAGGSVSIDTGVPASPSPGRTGCMSPPMAGSMERRLRPPRPTRRRPTAGVSPTSSRSPWSPL